MRANLTRTDTTCRGFAWHALVARLPVARGRRSARRHGRDEPVFSAPGMGCGEGLAPERQSELLRAAIERREVAAVLLNRGVRRGPISWNRSTHLW